jgi:DNA-binding SARP family transcriptional activator
MLAMTDQPLDDGTRTQAVVVSAEEPLPAPEATLRPPATEAGSAAPAGPPSVLGRVRIPRSRALPIARLDATMEQAWEHRLTLVVAPAGAGKTTLLARFASAAPGPVAWYRADGWDRDPVRMLRHLEQALRAAVPSLRGGWETVDDAITELEGGVPDRTLLVIDDLHTLESTDAEGVLERFIELVPSALTIVAASRVWPDMNLPRFKVAGELLDVGVDDLRFRSWEVEHLYRDFYGQPLPPEELAALTRRTEGWAAGLQLFHLATQGKPPAERRRLLDRMARPASRLTGEYLSRNVIAELPEELRAFLVGTCVLGRLTGPLCDRMLDRRDSAAVLRELEARCLFTLPLSEPGAYRYHEVFRLHLLGVLVDSVGEQESRRRHLRAGELLREAGAIPEALDALCRAESWTAVANLLGRDGSVLADGAAAWMSAVPPTLLRNDPWLILARARSLRAQGHFRAAVDAYSGAEATFGDGEGAATAAQERAPLLPWLDPDPPRVLPGAAASERAGGASAALRAATIREPASVALQMADRVDPPDRLVAGLSALLAGDLGRAQDLLGALAQASDTPALETVAAVLGVGVARALRGDQGGASDIEAGIAAAEVLGVEWLERIGRACLTLVGADGRDARLVADVAAASADAWGAALAGMLAGWSTQDAQARPELLTSAATGFRRLGAPVLEAWARALLALGLGRIDHPEAEQAAIAADALARTTGVQPARGLAQLALALVRDDPAGELATAARSTLVDAGLVAPVWADIADDDSQAAGSAQVAGVASASNSTQPAGLVEARCLGPLELIIDGQPVDLGTARPRVRSLLRLLLSEPGAPFHHEVIAEAFWPDAEPEVGARNLHAAVAALRRLVEPGAARGGFQLVVRDGASYRFVLAPGSRVDLVQFDRAVATARAARAGGDAAGAEGAWSDALALYRGELLADEGPATWLEEPRERRQQQAVEAAEAVATACFTRGELDDAARACSQGLRIDRYHDPLWRLLITVRERAGDPGAARRARQGYDRVLVELGVTAEA